MSLFAFLQMGVDFTESTHKEKDMSIAYNRLLYFLGIVFGYSCKDSLPWQEEVLLF